MKKDFSVAIALTISFGACQARGLSQGLTEYTATTSHSASATVKAGSALNKAAQKLAGRVNEKVPRSVEQPQQTNRQPSQVADNQPLPAGTQTSASTNGISVLCGPSNAQTAEQKSESPKQPCVQPRGKGSPGGKTNLPSKPEAERKYPSVVTLSFPK